MNYSIYRGNLVSSSDIKNHINKLAKTITSDLKCSNNLNSHSVIAAFDCLSKNINNNLSLYLNKENLNVTIMKQLHMMPGEILNLNVLDNKYKGYLPLGTIFILNYNHNIFSLFTSISSSLILGNITIIAAETDDMPLISEYLTKLIKFEPKLKKYIYLFELNKLTNEKIKTIIEISNAVKILGNDTQIARIKKLNLNNKRIITNNNKINISYVTKKGENKNTFSQIAKDYFGNYNGYYNNKIIYYECDTKRELLTFGEKISSAISKLDTPLKTDNSPLISFSHIPSIDLLNEKVNEIKVKDKNLKLYLSLDNSLVLNNNYNNIIIKQIKRSDLINTLLPYSKNIETIAIDCTIDELISISNLLLSININSFTSCGDLYKDTDYENLLQYINEIKLSNKSIPKGVYNLNEFKNNIPELAITEEAVTCNNLNSIKENCSPLDKGHLLLSLGLDTKKDIVTTIIKNNDFLNNYISNYELFKKLNAKCFEIGESNDYNYVLDYMFKNNTNTIIGDSNYVFNLLFSNKDWVNYYGKLEKIFYVGEEYTLNEYNALTKELNIPIVKPISSLGLSCPKCGYNVFHVNSPYVNVKILNFDSNNEVKNNDIGRLIWEFKDNNKIVKFESGQIGKWVKKPCTCGRITPRYEIVGEKGDVFLFNEKYINYNDMKNILSTELSYNGLFQIIVEKNSNDIIVLLEYTINTTKAYYALRKLNVINDIEESNPGTIKVYNLNPSEFSYDKNKVIHVISDNA